jgi:hypothetical protein
MKRSKHPRQPNYITKLHYLWRLGVIPREAGVHMVDVYHDTWCSIYKGKRCNCDPDVKLKVTVPASMN